MSTFAQRALPSTRRSSAHHDHVMGITYSDTHILAPYSDYAQITNKSTLEEIRGNAENVVHEALSDPRIKFCVESGDIDEVVNSPVKHLPVTDEEQTHERMKRINEYALGKRVVLSDEKLHSAAQMENHDLGNLFISVHEQGLTMARMHLPPATGKQLELLTRDPTEAMEDMLRKTMLRDDKLNDIVAKHMQHTRERVIRYPHVRFHRIIGNHERVDFYIDVLRKESEDLNAELKRQALTVHEKRVIIGDGLYLHFDQQLTPRKYHTNGRAMFGMPGMFDEAKKEMERSFVHQVLEDHGNKFVPAAFLADTIHTPHQVAYDVMHWHQENSPETLKGIKCIYGGHTHSPFTNFAFVYPQGGKRYVMSNTGAALSRFQSFNKEAFNPLRVTMRAGSSPAQTQDPDVFYPGATTLNIEQIRQPQAQHAR